jgi:FlaA1/EpsC-like NDP-sugar epimerase
VPQGGHPDAHGRPLGGGAAAPAEGDIAIHFTGLRPGEKLFEELLIGETSGQTLHPRIMTASETCVSREVLDDLLDKMLNACKMHDIAALRRLITFAPLGYTPSGPAADPLDTEEDMWLRAAAE